MFFQAQTIRILSLFMLLGAFSGLSGCSTWFTGDFVEPDVRLLKVEVVKARLVEQEFLLRFRVDNPNDVSLPVRGLVYTVYLNDVKLASGESDAWFTVPANGRHVFDVPVHTNLWRHMRYIVKLLERPDEPVQYRLQGEIRTGLLFGKYVQLRRNGEIIPGSFIPE
ncbi:LEA type 2 family protein [Pseudomonas sp. RIT-PI-AD]|uniref:LEA type 2 family protein n=1 Tax=Pseudomonas sp. RIT-PI-AD TaxID=3035294 RepID=UPI0021D9B7E3|nr:LEA type 2 family protein [Pseudomonas sp. RIT-PI-AD]